jgi:alpha-tubulin suppressor-like RCC1 family protein
MKTSLCSEQSWMQRASAGASVLALSIMLAACGGGGDAAPAPMIGAAGGTVTGPNGAQVVVPAGALGANTAIAVDQSSTGSPALPSGMNAFGAMFAFTPHGTGFATPVTVTVPFNVASVPVGVTPSLFKTNATGVWERVAGATLDAATMTAQVTGFSFLLVGSMPPQITTQAADAAVLEPATASFSVAAIGTPPFSYQWQRSDDGGTTFNDIVGATAASYTTGATNAAADNGDRYRVRVSNADGPSISVSATLTVTSAVIAPAITTQPQNVSVAFGAGATFTTVASGTSPAYQWQRSNDGGSTWADIANATNASYTLASAQAGDSSAQFRARASNAAGTVFSNAATLTVNPPSNIATAKLAAAIQHSLALARNGTVYSWGLNDFNALGRDLGLRFDTRAAPIPGLANVVDIATAGQTSLALLTDGTMRSWGANNRGLLGIGTIAQTPGVQTVSGLSGVTRIEMGYSHALALRSDGTVWAWGANVSGALGDGSKIDRTTPVQVSGLSNVIAIASGGSNSFALRADGTVWAWGEGDAGNSPLLLGQGGSAGDQLVPIQVQGVTGAVAVEASFANAFARNASGQMWAWGQGVPGVFDPTLSTLLPQLLGNLPVAAAYATGTCFVPTGVNPFNYLLIAQASGVLSAFGDAAAPVGGLAVLTNVTDVSAVDCHALALRSDGTVWAAGLNNAGQLGDSTTTNRNAPVQVLGLNLN